MQTLANVIDINEPSSSNRATVLIDIEEVAAALQTDMNVDQRSSFRSNSSNKTWDEVLRSWSGSQSLHRQISIEKKLFDQTNNSVYSPTQITIDDELSILLETSYAPNNMESFDDIVPVVSALERNDSNSNFLRPIKQTYKSPEAESIRLAIRSNIEKQLNDCSAIDAPSYRKVLIPVLQGMNGFVCGRLPSQDRAAILAYAESALGDQVRIMRCLVRIFLDYPQETESPPMSSENLTSDDSAQNEIASTTATIVSPRSKLVTSAQIENFLYWAYSVGDIIGLQVPFDCLSFSHVY